MYTMASGPRSPYLPICQILSDLCCNPLCCSVSEVLRKVQGGSQYLLGVSGTFVSILTVSAPVAKEVVSRLILGIHMHMFNKPQPLQMNPHFVFLLFQILFLSQTLHIMVGAINIILGVKLITFSPYPFWLGAVVSCAVHPYDILN